MQAPASAGRAQRSREFGLNASSRCVGAIVLAFAALLLARSVPRAHDFAITDVLVVLKSDGTYGIDMTLDLDALALGVSSSTDSSDVVAKLESMSAGEFAGAVERARDTLLRRVRIRFDGDKQIPHVGFPSLDAPPVTPLELPSVLGITARLVGYIPTGAREFTFGASSAFGPVQLTVLEQSELRTDRQLLEPGADSAVFLLGQTVSTQTSRNVATRSMVRGFVHIVPRGVEHVLFVLCLVLSSVRAGTLILEVLAFTVANAVTMGLALAGVLSLPVRPVETVIGLAVTYLAVENLLSREPRRRRLGVVVGLGLLHGAISGEAPVGVEPLPGQLLPELAGFTLGVGSAQLLVALAGFWLLAQVREKNGYRSRLVIPASVGLAAAGIYLAVSAAV